MIMEYDVDDTFEQLIYMPSYITETLCAFEDCLLEENKSDASQLEI